MSAEKELLDSLQSLVGSVYGLIHESNGVYGLHLNGDSAPWSELTEGGHFEEWLLPLSEASDVIDKYKGIFK